MRMRRGCLGGSRKRRANGSHEEQAESLHYKRGGQCPPYKRGRLKPAPQRMADKNVRPTGEVRLLDVGQGMRDEWFIGASVWRGVVAEACTLLA